MKAAHLDGKVRADALDGVAQVHVLVDGHDVRLARRHTLQQPAAAADVQDQLQVGVRLQHPTSSGTAVAPLCMLYIVNASWLYMRTPNYWGTKLESIHKAALLHDGMHRVTAG